MVTNLEAGREVLYTAYADKVQNQQLFNAIRANSGKKAIGKPLDEVLIKIANSTVKDAADASNAEKIDNVIAYLNAKNAKHSKKDAKGKDISSLQNLYNKILNGNPHAFYSQAEKNASLEKKKQAEVAKAAAALPPASPKAAAKADDAVPPVPPASPKAAAKADGAPVVPPVPEKAGGAAVPPAAAKADAKTKEELAKELGMTVSEYEASLKKQAELDKEKGTVVNEKPLVKEGGALQEVDPKTLEMVKQKSLEVAPEDTDNDKATKASVLAEAKKEDEAKLEKKDGEEPPAAGKEGVVVPEKKEESGFKKFLKKLFSPCIFIADLFKKLFKKKEKVEDVKVDEKAAKAEEPAKVES